LSTEKERPTRAKWYYQGLQGRYFYDAIIYRDPKLKRRVIGDQELQASRPQPEEIPKILSQKLNPDEQNVLREVMYLNPLIAPGIHGTKLYRLLVSLRNKTLVFREGYRYYPTKYAYLWLDRQNKEKGTLTDWQIRSAAENRDWREIFRTE